MENANEGIIKKIFFLKNDVIYGSQYECSFCYLFHCVYVRAIIKCALVAVKSCTQKLHIFSVNITTQQNSRGLLLKYV